MSRSIGPIDFDLFFGRVANLKTRSEVFEIFGQDGVGIQVGGLGDGQFTLTTVFFAANAGDAENHINSCEDLQGQIVSIVDARDNVFDDCFVYHLDTNNCDKSVWFRGNNDAVRVQLQWTFQRTA